MSVSTKYQPINDANCKLGLPRHHAHVNFILEWTTSLDTSFRTLFVMEDVHVTSKVELRNYVPLFGVTQSNVDLRNYVISRQIVIGRRVT